MKSLKLVKLVAAFVALSGLSISSQANTLVKAERIEPTALVEMAKVDLAKSMTNLNVDVFAKNDEQKAVADFSLEDSNDQKISLVSYAE